MDKWEQWEKLNLLRYASKWLTSGFIDEDFLERQMNDLQNGVDWRTEHYRLQAFLNWIDARECYTDAEIDMFIDLVELDESRMMAFTAAIRLLRRKGLTDAQFERLSEWVEQAPDKLQRAIGRTRCFRELQGMKSITEKEFKRFAALRIAEVDEYLLLRFSMNDRVFLKRLAEKSVSERARTIAAWRMRRLEKCSYHKKAI